MPTEQKSHGGRNADVLSKKLTTMRNLNFKADENGQLIYVSKSGMRGTDPIISQTIPFPGSMEEVYANSTTEVEIDGEVITLKIYSKSRTSMHDTWAKGVEVYGNGQLLTTSYHYCRYPGDNEFYGTNEFFYKGSWYLVFNESISPVVGYDKDRYPQLEEHGYKIIKFGSTKATTIGEIVNILDYGTPVHHGIKKIIEELWGKENVPDKIIRW